MTVSSEELKNIFGNKGLDTSFIDENPDVFNKQEEVQKETKSLNEYETELLDQMGKSADEPIEGIEGFVSKLRNPILALSGNMQTYGDLVKELNRERNKSVATLNAVVAGFGDEISQYAGDKLDSDRLKEMASEIKRAESELSTFDSVTAELLGSIVPGGVIAKGVDKLAKGASATKRILASAALEGGVSSAGYSDADNLTERATDAAIGSGLGLVTAGTLSAVSSGGNKIIKMIKSDPTKVRSLEGRSLVKMVDTISKETGVDQKVLLDGLEKGQTIPGILAESKISQESIRTAFERIAREDPEILESIGKFAGDRIDELKTESFRRSEELDSSLKSDRELKGREIELVREGSTNQDPQVGRDILREISLQDNFDSIKPDVEKAYTKFIKNKYSQQKLDYGYGVNDEVKLHFDYDEGKVYIIELDPETKKPMTFIDDNGQLIDNVLHEVTPTAKPAASVREGIESQTDRKIAEGSKGNIEAFGYDKPTAKGLREAEEKFISGLTEANKGLETVAQQQKLVEKARALLKSDFSSTKSVVELNDFISENNISKEDARFLFSRAIDTMVSGGKISKFLEPNNESMNTFLKNVMDNLEFSKTEISNVENLLKKVKNLQTLSSVSSKASKEPILREFITGSITGSLRRAYYSFIGSYMLPFIAGVSSQTMKTVGRISRESSNRKLRNVTIENLQAIIKGDQEGFAKIVEEVMQSKASKENIIPVLEKRIVSEAIRRLATQPSRDLNDNETEVIQQDEKQTTSNGVFDLDNVDDIQSNSVTTQTPSKETQGDGRVFNLDDM